MAIRMVDGVPGSGKSYYAVKHLAETYFECDHAGFWKPKQQIGKNGQDQKLVISTNLEGLKLPHISLEDEIRKAGGVQYFFSHTYQEEIEKDDEKRIYVVDEAQKYFRKRVSGDWSDTWFYFEKHRHFGHDIYLLTQNPKKINVEITDLMEYRIHAKPRVRSVTGELSYQMISDGDIMKRFGCRPNQKIFDLYKSRRKGETEKISNPIMKKVFMAVVAVLFIGSLGFYFLYLRLHPESAQASTDIPIDKAVKNNSYVPVAHGNEGPSSNFSAVEKKFVPLSLLTLYENGKEEFYIFMGGTYFKASESPYNLKRVGSKVFAELTLDEYEMLYGDIENNADQSKDSSPVINPVMGET